MLTPMVSTSDHVRRKQMMKAISRARLTATTAKRSRCFFVFYSLANGICKSILVFDCFVFVFKLLQDSYSDFLSIVRGRLFGVGVRGHLADA